jgi:serine/threonine protein kinase
VDAGLGHPSIVAPIAAGIEGGTAYLAQEYVAGESLDIAIRHYAPARLDTALPFLAQLAGAIDFARAAGLGHGTLHPRDIFLTPDEARATGFGIATVLEAVGLRVPVRRPYSAPERVAGEKWGAAADVYSLAAIGYELLTGRRIPGPVAGPDALELRPADPLVSRLLAGPLARALAEHPAARYPGALAFARALEAAAEGEEERQVTAVPDVPKVREIPKVPEVPRVPEVPKVREVQKVREVSPPAKVQPSLVDALDEAASAEASPPKPEPKLKLRVPEKKTEPEEPQREVIPALRKEPEVVVPPEPEPSIERALDRGLGREPEPDLALSPALREPRAPLEAIEPLEPMEPMEPMDPMEPAVLHELRESREPMRVLPLAVMLVAGLLVGFVAGYAVGTRGEPGAGGSAAAQPAGTAWSEAKVDPAAAPSPALSPAETPAPAAAPAPPAAVATRGTIVVRSTPARAGVVVDGVWRGRTPLTLSDLALGTHTIRIAERGYSRESREITLSAAQNSQDIQVSLAATATSTTGSTRPAPARPRPQPAPSRSARPAPAAPPRPAAGPTQYTGTLYVDSRPRGARVFVDGRAVGVTPLQLGDIPVGSRVIRLELPNHRTWTDSKRVVAGETTRVSGSLEQIR